MAEAVSMVDMEARLAADVDGLFREETLNRLRTETSRLKERLDKGVSPDEYPALERVALALETAANTVDRIWRQHHHRRS